MTVCACRECQKNDCDQPPVGLSGFAIGLRASLDTYVVRNMPFGLPRRSDLAALAATGLYLWLSIALRGCPPPSGGGEDEHSLQIPGHRHQTPFAANFIEPAQ